MLEVSKADAKQHESKQHDESKQTSEMKNNNKTTSSKACNEFANESDDDDSVFINENKPKKANKTTSKHRSNAQLNVQPAACDASSVMLNASSSNVKLAAPVAAQNHNSRDLTVTSETVAR